MQMEQPTILITCKSYLPGYKGGGPIRSVANVIDHLGDDYAFRILTRDRDLGDTAPYPDIAPMSWRRLGQAEVMYVSPAHLSFRWLRQILQETHHDLLYLQSFFDPNFTIKPLLLRRLGQGRRVPVIVAPRGEFSEQAMQSKRAKKLAYLGLAKMLGLYGNVIWQASSPQEAADIRRCFGARARVVVAPDLRSAAPSTDCSRRAKPAGSLHIVHLSRISPMKNLLGALRALYGVQGDVSLDIYGPLEDTAYWAQCQTMISQMPANIKVTYRRAVPHDQVIQVLSQYDLFFLPTQGENFGHVILEALVAGTPVLLSDQTPWRHLESLGVGWDLPLDQPERFTAVLQQCVHATPEEHRALCQRAAEYGCRSAQDQSVVEQSHNLLQLALAGSR